MANGRIKRSPEEENKSGEMAQYIKGPLKIAWPTGKADSSTHVETCTKVIGSTTKLKAKESTCTLMGLCTLVNGPMTSSMVTDRKNGLMDHNMKEISKMD